MYNIKLEKFEGPLDLLLQLIEEDELNISEISLAAIADEYVEYIKSHKEDINADELSDFLVVAAKLLLIKSKYLMPFLETAEDEEIYDLEKRLKIYKEFLEASAKINEYFLSKNVSFAREKISLYEPKELFNPPKNLTANDLMEIYKALVARLKPAFNPLDEESIRKTISVHEKLKQIKDLLLKRVKTSFSKLADTKDKSDIIVCFLAILELSKQRMVIITQEDHFADIEVSLVEE